jgi:hypothetical protein
MLAVIQIPFTDARPFLDNDTSRIPFPSWPLPKAGNEFVRSFGIIRERVRGGLQDWPGEEVYCDAARALRFADRTNQTILSSLSENVFQRKCAFRRFMSDGRFPDGGSVVSRLEVGLRYRRRSKTSCKINLPSLIHEVLSTKVLLPRDKVDSPRELLSIASKFAGHYLQSSTRQAKKSIATEAWWITSGIPLLLLEYRVLYDQVELPKYTKKIVQMADANLELSHCRIEYRGFRFGVWLISLGPDVYDRDLLRRIRLNLFRLHAEKEGIKNILRLVSQQRLKIERGMSSSERLQEYLKDSIRLLTCNNRDGLPQSTMLEAAQNYDSIVNEGERSTLLTQLSSIRPNILKRVEQFTQEEPGRYGLVYTIKANNVTINNEQNGSKTVNNQTIDFGSGNNFRDVNVVAAKTIQDSFNRVANSNVKDELREALNILHIAVTGMCKQLPEEKQSEVTKDLQALSSEAVSLVPRKKWYELSAEGLEEAAKMVGEIANPVVTAVKAVLALLG